MNPNKDEGCIINKTPIKLIMVQKKTDFYSLSFKIKEDKKGTNIGDKLEITVQELKGIIPTEKNPEILD